MLYNYNSRAKGDVNKMLKVRLAVQDDLTKVMQIFVQAQSFLAQCKIPQWQDNTPNKSVFLTDIKQSDLWLLVDDKQEILGIAALKKGPDPFYLHISEGKWLSDRPYYAIHRFALSDNARGRHLSRKFMGQLLQIISKYGIDHVRIDTHPKNEGMQRVIRNAGFSYCGIVEVTQEQSDPVRKAYELTLH